MKTKETRQELEERIRQLKIDKTGLIILFVILFGLLMLTIFLFNIQSDNLETQLSKCQEQVPYEVSTSMISVVGSNVKVYIDGDLRSVNPSKNGTINFWIDTIKQVPVWTLKIECNYKFAFEENQSIEIDYEPDTDADTFIWNIRVSEDNDINMTGITFHTEANFTSYQEYQEVIKNLPENCEVLE